MTSRHPELATEQKVVDRTHDCHEAALAFNRAIVAGEHNGGGDAFAQRKLRETAIKKLAKIEGVDTARLVVGRLDFQDEARKPVYIGPCSVFDDTKVVVVDWTMPIAKGFYNATLDDPQGLTRRRSFDVKGRELRDISDEIFGNLSADMREQTESGPSRTVLDRVASELEEAREPHMKDMVASIVADQYRMIEAPHEGIFIVQGGPGTGKTAVALHRAVFLLRNDESLARVLVVGPNAAFMAYIAQVLPGLGETTVDQLSIDRLARVGDAVAIGNDPSDLATLKGDARMAEVLRRAVRLRVKPTQDSVGLSAQGVSVRMTAEIANQVLEAEVARGRAYMDGRRRFIDSMRSAAEALFDARFTRSLRRRSLDREALQRYVTTDREWNNFIERMWPTASAVQVVHELLTVDQRMAAAADGLLDEGERVSLMRRGIRTVGVHPWTHEDLPLIDEAQALVQVNRDAYDYVIVDEAQDLTPMQLRMVARRSAQGDLTLVGDIAQATGPTRYSDWDEVVRQLPAERGVRFDELVIGYRVPRSIMELANALLPKIAPTLTPTQPVREARIEPRFDSTSPEWLADMAAAAVMELADDNRTVGVIVPARHMTDVRGALAAEGIAAGDISTDQLAKRVTLLSSTESKGLEFDRVVLVEPWDIVASSTAGWSELYVALSRATQQLIVVHSQPLPAPLPGGVEMTDDAFEVTEPMVETPEVETFDDVPDLDLDLDLDPGNEEPAETPVPEASAGTSSDTRPTPAEVGVSGVELVDPEAVEDLARSSENAPLESLRPEDEDPVAEVAATREESEPNRATPEHDASADADGLAASHLPTRIDDVIDDSSAEHRREQLEDLAAALDLGISQAVSETEDAVEVEEEQLETVPSSNNPPTKPVRARGPLKSDVPRIGGDFAEALALAQFTHGGAARRGTAVPYVGHLLGTVALVLEDGGSEAEAIAAMLHDAVEDGHADIASIIQQRFGDVVAAIVLGCTDPDGPELSFREMKLRHIAQLEAGSASVRRVALAEKLDNARALARDLERYGNDVWRRMGVDQQDLLWYYENLVALFRRSFPSVLSKEFERTVDQIKRIAEP